MLARRLLLLAAVLMLLTALAAGLAPRQPADEPDAGDVHAARRHDRDRGDPGRGRARTAGSSCDRGDVLRLEVSGDILDSVLIERLDRMEAIAPLTPARFEMLAEAPAGVYPIRLVDADRRIGSIEIRD